MWSRALVNGGILVSNFGVKVFYSIFILRMDYFFLSFLGDKKISLYQNYENTNF